MTFRGIRGHPFLKTWEWRGIRFHKMGIRFFKTPFLEGISCNQLLLLKLKRQSSNTHVSLPTPKPGWPSDHEAILEFYRARCLGCGPHTHTYTHRARIRTRTRTRTHARTHARTRAHTHTDSRTHTRAHTHARMRAHTHTHTRTHITIQESEQEAFAKEREKTA